jgi:general secretion pathway protein M
VSRLLKTAGPARSLGATPSAWLSVKQQLGTRWSALAVRERRYVGIAALLVGVALLWMFAIQPAWRVTSEAPAKLDQLDLQLQHMQRLQSESAVLRAAPPVAPSQAATALKSATERLGDGAKLAMQGDRATLTLTAVSADALRAWLQEARSTARARPVEMKLVRNPRGFTGSLVVSLGGTP